MTEDQLLHHYELMIVIRRFEETLYDLYGTGVIMGTSHFCAGQEGAEVGAIGALRPDDYVSSNHRGHGQFGQAEMDPRKIGGQSDVQPRIDQGAVQVENECFGPPAFVFSQFPCPRWCGT